MSTHHFDGALRLFQRHHHRFGADDMFPGLRCRLNLGKMEMIGRIDAHHLNIRPRQQFFIRQRGKANVLLALHLGQQRWIGITKRPHLQPGRRVAIHGDHIAPHAEADDANANVFHGDFFLGKGH